MRAELKDLEFNFNYNFDQQTINFDAIKINNEINKKVNKVLKKIILQENKFQNKIYFRNILREALVAYVG